MASGADQVIRWFSTLALLVVWAISAGASFTHVRDMAVRHGQHGWVAWAIAVSMELVVGMAALEMLRDSRTGHRSGVPWLVLLVGAGLVLATNVASAEPSPWGWVLAGWPATASMAATKLFVRRLRHAADAYGPRPAAASQGHAASGGMLRVPAQGRLADGRGTATAYRNGTNRQVPTGTDTADGETGSRNGTRGTTAARATASGTQLHAEREELRHRARRLYAESVRNGRPLTGAEIAQACGMSDRWGRQRIAETRRETETAPRLVPLSPATN